MSRRDLLFLIVPGAQLVLSRIVPAAGLAAGASVGLRLALAWIALVVAPALLLAASGRRGRPIVDALAAGAGDAIALFSLLAFLTHLLGGGLSALLAAHPIAVLIAAGARLAWRQRAVRARPPAAKAPPPAPAGAAARATRRAAALLGVALVGLALARPRPVDFTMDVYDHVGAAARMSARDAILSHEMSDGDAGPRLDPRKGTWNALLAATHRLSGTEPLALWPAATVMATLLGALCLARLARAFVGSEWPLAWVISLLAFEGGPQRGWLGAAAYPGVLGVLLYALFLAECSDALRRRCDFPALLGIALPLVHAMAGVFAAISAAALVVVTARGSGRAAAPGTLAPLSLLATVIGLLLAWRALAAGPAANAVQSELQGVLFLPGGWLVPEPRTLFERLGAEGLLGLAASPLLVRRARHDIGWMWLLALVVVLLALASPPIATFLAPRVSYLLRRIPALAPLPLLAAAGMIELARRAAVAPHGVRRATAAFAALLFALVPAARARDALALAAAPHPRARAAAAAEEPAWTADLVALFPPAAARGGTVARGRIAADPVTSYALYARTLERPLVLPDQHAPPNDAGAPERLRDLARLLSPRTSAAEREVLTSRRGVSHILVNEGIGEFVGTFGYPITAAQQSALRAALDADSSRARCVGTAGALRLYAMSPARASSSPDDSESAMRAVAAPAAETRAFFGTPGEAGLNIVGATLSAGRAAPGERLIVRCALGTIADAPPVGDYAAHLAVTRARRADASRGDPLAQARRSLARILGRHSDRFVYERTVGARYPVILWRPGETFEEEYGIRIPPDAPPGYYRVTMSIVRRPVFQNRTLAALLTDRDEYAGMTIGEIEVVVGADVAQ